MTSGMRTLRDVLSGGAGAWVAETSVTLARALDAGGVKAGPDLSEFIRAVLEWLHEPAENRRGRLTWVEEHATPWLRRLSADSITRMAGNIAGLSERQLFLKRVFATPSRPQLGPALEEQARILSGEWGRSERNRYAGLGRMAVELADMAGALQPGSMHDLLTRLFELFGPALLAEVLADLGSARFFDYSIDEWAMALPAVGEPSASAFAVAFSRQGGLRLREVLQEMLASPGHGAKMSRRPSAEQVDRWLASVRRSLHAISPELSGRVEAFARGIREHDRDVGAVFAAYLSVVPSNHEEVFDLFSAHAPKIRWAPGPTDWNLPSVMSRVGGSMRASSPVSKQDGASFDAPDFSWERALAAVPVSAITNMVLDQRSPEFALTYLALVRASGHPSFDQVCAALAAGTEFRERLRGVSGVMAAIVIQRLAHLARDADPLRGLLTVLVPELVACVPTQYLRSILHELMFRGEEEELVRAEIALRFPSLTTVDDLEDLLEAAGEFMDRAEVLQKLAALNLRNFGVEPGSSDEAVRQWLFVVVRLASMYGGEPAQMIVSSNAWLAPRCFGTDVFGAGEYDDDRSAARKLTLKVLILEQWAASDLAAAARALRDNLERDVKLWFRASFRAYGDSTPHDLPVSKWLSLVERIAPEQVDVYVNTAMAFARIDPQQDGFGPSISDAAAVLGAWLTMRDRVANEAFDILLKRLRKIDASDYQSAASSAAVTLPAAVHVLQAFRESAVAEVASRLAESRGYSVTGPLEHLRTVLAAEDVALVSKLFGV